MTDDLREQIARAIFDGDPFGEVTNRQAATIADAVLAVLPDYEQIDEWHWSGEKWLPLYIRKEPTDE